ncbi:NAD(P)H-dependent oxidoreductase [Rasiella rasia]|uniref:NAD(P)H-dependent oxidoreductase n=1 Tax=Rasiella rasia TaxID=2744027 RepID=A0A6G6GJW9_9FLAO|nr:NAD(P)H-dependent oxidoreductase [Rasiella rasia]QIE58790.1 NAD(P)H-dependent oxidoreductase [Rasiella rasia]
MENETLQKLAWRYATKKFDISKKLSEEKLHILKEAFNLTATSYGLQPLKMVVIQNQEVKEQLVPITMEQQQVADASHVLVLCVERTLSKSYIEEYFNRVAAIRNTPKAILQPFETFLVDSFSEKDTLEVRQWMEKQAYIALGNLLTVCAYEGIDACPIEGFEPKKYDEFLDLASHNLHSVLVLAVGYRASDDMFATLKKVRKGADTVIINH